MEQHKDKIKTGYFIFDFFAVCEYFEEKFNYDQVLSLPTPSEDGIGKEPHPPQADSAVIYTPDPLKTIDKTVISVEGMKIDRMFFQKFEKMIKQDPIVKQGVNDGKWDFVLDYINQTMIDKPEDFFTLEKLRYSLQLDRRISLREIVEKAFGLIPGFKSKDELLNSEFDKFISIFKPSTTDNIPALKYYFKAYITDNRLRDIIDSRDYVELNTYPSFGMRDFRAVKDNWRTVIPEYIKDYVVLNKFM